MVDALRGRLAAAATLWNPTTFDAIDGAARQQLATRGDVDPLDYLDELGAWQGFGLEVIFRYERLRRERSVFRRFYRWRDGNG